MLADAAAAAGAAARRHDAVTLRFAARFSLLTPVRAFTMLAVICCFSPTPMSLRYALLSEGRSACEGCAVRVMIARDKARYARCLFERRAIDIAARMISYYSHTMPPCHADACRHLLSTFRLPPPMPATPLAFDARLRHAAQQVR